MSVYVYKYRCKNISVICIYTHVSVCLCVHAQQYGCISACLCVCVYVCPNLYRSPPVCIYVRSLCVHACMHACTYLILFQCAYIYMCICVCICMYVHTHTLSGTASNAFTCHCSSKKLSQDHNMLTTGGKKSKDRKDFRRWVASCRRKQDAGFMCILTQLARSSCYA